MKKTYVAVITAALTLAPLAAGAATTETAKHVTVTKTTTTRIAHEPASAEQARLQREAKISMAAAKGIALSHVKNGVIKSSELEREHGKLIYSFDIREAGRNDVTEVNVDAMTGSLVAIDHENIRKEAAEKKQEAAEKSKH